MSRENVARKIEEVPKPETPPEVFETLKPEEQKLRIVKPGERMENQDLVQQSLGSLRKILDDITDIKGLAGRQMIEAKIANGTFEDKDLEEGLNQIGDRAELQEKVLEFLEKEKIIEYGPQGEIIADLEKFKKGGIADGLKRDYYADFHAPKKNRPHAIHKFYSYAKEGQPFLLYSALKDLQVVSKEDWQAGKREAKPLFYTPETSDKAFDVEEIKKSNFYLGLWQVGLFRNITKIDYPSFHEKMKINEVTMACLIYHPQLGNGFRDEKGQLMVRDKSRNYKQISSKWFREVEFQGGSQNLRSSIFTPQTYLIEKAPNLLKFDLLKTRDFRGTLSGYASAEKYRISRERVGKDGFVMFEGVRYYVGREFHGQPNIKIYKISDTLAGISETAKGKEELICTFHLADKKDPRLTSWKPKQREHIYYFADKEVTALEKYDPVKFNQKRSGETLEQYQERLKNVEDFKFLLKFSGDISRKAGIDLSQLTLQEQKWAVSATKGLKENYQKILNLVKEQGITGLRSFLSLEYGTKMGDKVLTIAENIDKETAEVIFDKYFEVVGMAEKVRDFLRNNFNQFKNYSDELMEKIVLNLLGKGKQLIVDFTRQIQEAKLKKQKIDVKEFLQRLEAVKMETMLFASTFKVASAEEPLDLNEIKGSELASKTAEELTPQEKERMKEIFIQNRPHYTPELKKACVKEFEEALVAPGRRFYLLNYNQELISFLRFEELPNGNLYLGSFNVAPNIKSHRIGSAMLKAALEKEAVGRTVELVVYEKNPVLKSYVDDFGFRIVGEDSNYHNTGQKFFHLERPPQKAVMKKED